MLNIIRNLRSELGFSRFLQELEPRASHMAGEPSTIEQHAHRKSCFLGLPVVGSNTREHTMIMNTTVKITMYSVFIFKLCEQVSI